MSVVLLSAEPGATSSLSAYLADWLAHIRTRVRPTTYEGYEVIVRLHISPHIGEVELADLRPLHLQRLYAALLQGLSGRPLASGTVLNVHLVLTQALSQAVRWGLLGTNPAAGAQPPRPRRAELLTVDAALAARILQVAQDSRIELAIALAVGNGNATRRDPCPSLARRRPRAADDLRPTLMQPTAAGVVVAEPKTRRSRRGVAMPRFLLPYFCLHRERQDARRAELAEFWQETDLVIDAGDGGPINPDTLSSCWRALVRTHGLPLVRFHDLRHAHATLMLLKGVHPKIVSERLGHASIGITLDTYSHVLPSMQAEAAEAVDELFAPAASTP